MLKKIAKRFLIYLTSATLIFSSVPGVVQAHSGRTDSAGGHHDNKNVSGLGSYHYHCGGNPPHLHNGGVCPYSTSSQSSTTSNASSELEAISNTVQNSSATTTATPSNTIKLGENNEISITKDIIKMVQYVLDEKGYNCGGTDGLAGEKTKQAIKSYLESDTTADTDHIIISMVAEGLGI